MLRPAFSVFISVLITTGLVGCSLRDRVTTVDRTYLEDVDIRSKLPNLPYAHSWVRPDFNGSLYTKLYVRPVRTDLLPPGDWVKSSSPFIDSPEAYQAEAKAVARHLKSEIESKVRGYDDNRFTIVDRPGSDVLTLDIALTELEFSHPIARAASLAAPVPGTGPAFSAISDPHAAFAARLIDGNGRLAATAADRKFPPTRLIDFNKLTYASSVREVCSLWAVTLAEALNKGRFVKTEDNARFSLVPW